MQLPAIDLPVAIQLIGAIVTITGVYFTLKLGQAQLRKDFDDFKTENRAELESLRGEVSRDQTESQRLLLALHTRFDKTEGRVGKVEINHAVLEERVKNLREDKVSLRDTGRFRVARREAELAGQAPMFEIIEGE